MVGSTVVILLLTTDVGVCIWVGDSRLYQFRNHEVQCISRDHSLVQTLIERGEIKPEDARNHPSRNVITRAVGNRDYVQVDTLCVKCQLGDAYLLCSDGLHGYLETDEIPEIVALGGQRVVDGFIDLANERGGRDNITAILVEVW